MAEDEIVQFDNVGLRYGTDREVLSNVSFTLFPGRFYFLTGASGAGKPMRDPSGDLQFFELRRASGL